MLFVKSYVECVKCEYKNWKHFPDSAVVDRLLLGLQRLIWVTWMMIQEQRSPLSVSHSPDDDKYHQWTLDKVL